MLFFRVDYAIYVEEHMMGYIFHRVKSQLFYEIYYKIIIAVILYLYRFSFDKKYCSITKCYDTVISIAVTFKTFFSSNRRTISIIKTIEKHHPWRFITDRTFDEICRERNFSTIDQIEELTTTARIIFPLVL